ncbi:Uncharacterised protein [Alistipes sp. cv1]|nr:Uncharacterised protein [Faecalibacterium prausnitzii]
MAYRLPVDDGRHLVFPLCQGGLHGDPADFHLAPVHLLPVPALVLAQHLQVPAVYRRSVHLPDGVRLFIISLLSPLLFQRQEQLPLLPLPLFQFLPYFRVQVQGDTPVAVELFHRYLVGEIRPDHPVQHFQPLPERLFLDGAGRQRGRLFVRQVIDHIRRDAFRLHGQRPFLRVHDQAVRSEALLPFLIGEIDRRGDQFLVGPCRFPAARAARHRRNGRLQFFQHIPLLCRLYLPAALVVEAVAARLQLAGLHASIPAFGDDGSTRIEQLPADPPQVETPLVARRPAQERRRHAQPSQPPVLADADTVAVQPHGNTAVGVTGMDEIFGHVEVLAYDACQHVVGFLVGRVRSPVRQSQHLTFGNAVGQQRRIVPLHEKPVARAVMDDVGLHPVTPEYVLHLGLQVHHPGIGILSYRHIPLL